MTISSEIFLSEARILIGVESHIESSNMLSICKMRYRQVLKEYKTYLRTCIIKDPKQLPVDESNSDSLFKYKIDNAVEWVSINGFGVDMYYGGNLSNNILKMHSNGMIFANFIINEIEYIEDNIELIPIDIKNLIIFMIAIDISQFFDVPKDTIQVLRDSYKNLKMSIRKSNYRIYENIR